MPCKNHPRMEDRLARCSRCAGTFCPDCLVEIGGLAYCLTCKAESLRDLRSGVTFSGLDLASVGRRFAAVVIDGLVVTLPLLIPALLVLVLLVLAHAEDRVRDVLLSAQSLFTNLATGVLGFILYSFYEGLMLASGGQTVGKRVMKIKVVTAQGRGVTAGQAWSRAVVRSILAAVPGFTLFDHLFVFGPDRATLHDRIARTRVVRIPVESWRAAAPDRSANPGPDSSGLGRSRPLP